MMGLQLFFCSGHFCEFSGLQYASAFIGFDSMVWYSSGALLLLNTCGFLALALLSLPLMLACCCGGGGGGGGGGGVHGSGDGAAGSTALQQQGLLVVSSMRFAALAVAMISAAVQQQHILLWAIFAPKLVFELWFMAVTDVALLASAAAVGG
jgi:phosphatidylinositol glycan class O